MFYKKAFKKFSKTFIIIWKLSKKKHLSFLKFQLQEKEKNPIKFSIDGLDIDLFIFKNL